MFGLSYGERRWEGDYGYREDMPYKRGAEAFISHEARDQYVNRVILNFYRVKGDRDWETPT